MKLDIGFLHRGFEKSCENVTWTQVLPVHGPAQLRLADDEQRRASRSRSRSSCGLDVPERAQYMRVIGSEIHRICDHLTCVGAMAMELGAFTAVPLRHRGARPGSGPARRAVRRAAHLQLRAHRRREPRPARGLDREDPQDARQDRRSSVDEIDGCSRNRIFVDRTSGTGVISREDALDYGFTGPCLRASASTTTSARPSPYWVYDRIDFDVPIGTNGDNFDRYLMRIEEMRQSDRIIRQSLEADAEPGEIVDDLRIALPPKPEVYGTIEGVMAHFKLVMEGIQVPAGEVYDSTEAANGELGFYVVSDGGGRPTSCTCARRASPSWPRCPT